MSDTLDLTCELIHRRSITPNDAGCQQILASRLERAGFLVAHLRFGEVDNIWARRGTEGPVLCLAGHTDVVPSGPTDDWSSDPFEPVIRDGFLYGRGAADMKSGLAAMTTAAESFLADCPDHPGSLAFLITSDEEGPADDGTLRVVEWLAERNERIDWAIVGEPSSSVVVGDTIRIGRRGSLGGRLVVHGIQGHIAYPETSDNPIHRFAPALVELCQREWDHGSGDFPPTSFQFSNLESGTGATNVIPGHLEAWFNFRYSDALDPEDIRVAVAETLDKHGLRHEIHWQHTGEPYFSPAAELADAATRALEECAAVTPKYSTSGGTSDGRFISAVGAQVIELGPVNQSIHQIDEHVCVEDIDRLHLVYRRILELMLVPGKAED